MSVLSIAKEVARNVGLEDPTQVFGSTDPNSVKVGQFINETGQELARRGDWAALEKVTTITGTGSNDAFALPSDFARLTNGNAVSVAGAAIRGSLSRDEWFSLTHSEGTPRYFRLMGGAVSFYPFPADGVSISVSYIGSGWCSAGNVLMNDSNTILLPEPLVARGAIWRFKRSIGADFSDHMAEYEAMLEQLAVADQRERSP